MKIGSRDTILPWFLKCYSLFFQSKTKEKEDDIQALIVLTGGGIWHVSFCCKGMHQEKTEKIMNKKNLNSS